MDLYPHQEAYVETEGDAYLQGARRTGKTTAAAVDGWTRALDAGETVMVIAHTHDQGIQFVDEIREIISPVDDGMFDVDQRSKLSIHDAGSIKAVSSYSLESKDVGHMLQDVDTVIMDEPAYIKDRLFLELTDPQYGVTVRCVGSPPTNNHSLNDFADWKTTKHIWAHIWENPNIDTEHLSQWRKNLPVKKELVEVYGVSPPNDDTDVTE